MSSHFFAMTSLVAATAVLTACGGASFAGKDGQARAMTFQGSALAAPDEDDDSSSGSGSDSGSGSSSSSSAASAATGTEPLYEFRVGTIGYNKVAVTVRANKILKLKFAPGQQDEKVKDTGFSPLYSKLGVYITLGSTSTNTQMLTNGFNGTEAQESRIINLSNSFHKLCSSDDPSCRQNVTIVIEKPNYDYWCLNYVMYCPWSQIWQTHPWNGVLTIQTDDTVAL